MAVAPPNYGPPRPPPPRDPLLRYVLRPAALSLMAICVAWPLGQVVASFVPGAQPLLIVAACTLAALEASYAYTLIRGRYLRGSELFRFRVVEYGLYYVLIRLGQLALQGVPPELVRGALAGDLDAALRLLLDVQTLLVLCLAVLVNFLAIESLSDLDKAEEPPERDVRPEKNAVSPADALTGRFFTVGAAVLVLSGLARVRLTELLVLDRAPVAGLVLNVLIYFFVGLVLLGRVRLAQLAGRWHLQGVRTPPELASRWVRYSLAFVGLSALLAFLLPTGYTSGALGVIGDLLLLVMTALWVIMVGLLTLLFLPLAWLVSQLFGAQVVEPIQQVQEQILLPPQDPRQLASWLEVLRPFVIWTLVIGMVLYVVIAYLRDRPELLAALRRLAPLRGLGRLWAALRHRLSGLAAAAEKLSPLAWLRERLARATPPKLGFFRLGGASPREQVLYYYLSLLRRAGEIGVQRRPAQTPREYQPRLAGELPEAAPDIAALTDAFIEARYSARPTDAAAPGRARALWGRLRAALRERKINDPRGHRPPP